MKKCDKCNNMFNEITIVRQYEHDYSKIKSLSTVFECDSISGRLIDPTLVKIDLCVCRKCLLDLKSEASQNEMRIL